MRGDRTEAPPPAARGLEVDLDQRPDCRKPTLKIWRQLMRRIPLMIGVAVVLLTVAGSASARPLVDHYDYPYCLQGRDRGYPAFATSGLTNNAWRPHRHLFLLWHQSSFRFCAPANARLTRLSGTPFVLVLQVCIAHPQSTETDRDHLANRLHNRGASNAKRRHAFRFGWKTDG